VHCLLHEVGHVRFWPPRDPTTVFRAFAEKYEFTPFTDYGRKNAWEYFAETHALHLYAPDQLQATNQRMFDWFQGGLSMSKT
jgi:hypothetical protein